MTLPIKAFNLSPPFPTSAWGPWQWPGRRLSTSGLRGRGVRKAASPGEREARTSQVVKSSEFWRYTPFAGGWGWRESGRGMRGWSLRKASCKLCRMKKQNKDQGPGNQTGLDMENEHSRLYCHLRSLPRNLCERAKLNGREGVRTLNVWHRHRKGGIFCVKCVW